jgi:hypothetical protein
VPTAPVALAKIGAALGLVGVSPAFETTMVRRASVVPALFVAWIGTLKVPAVVGVPPIAVPLKASPCGRSPTVYAGSRLSLGTY